MNVNTMQFADDCDVTLESEVREHHGILITATGVELTGEWLLIPEGPDHPCSMQVWSKTTSGTWVWVDVLGFLHERANPLILEDLTDKQKIAKAEIEAGLW